MALRTAISRVFGEGERCAMSEIEVAKSYELELLEGVT